jgi:hypothetical protein
MTENRKYPGVRAVVRALVPACIVVCSFELQQLHAQQNNLLTASSSITPSKLASPIRETSIRKSFSLLKMTSADHQFSQNFLLRNNDTHPVTITDIELASERAGIGLTSLVGADLPVVIESGGSITVRLEYISPDHKQRADTILLAQENGIITRIPINAIIDATDADELGLGRREITMTVTPNALKRTIDVNLYRYVGEISIYTMSGKLVDVAKNVRSFVWHATRGKKFYDEKEYLVKVSSTDGGYSFNRTEHVSFASQ